MSTSFIDDLLGVKAEDPRIKSRRSDMTDFIKTAYKILEPYINRGVGRFTITPVVPEVERYANGLVYALDPETDSRYVAGSIKGHGGRSVLHTSRSRDVGFLIALDTTISDDVEALLRDFYHAQGKRLGIRGMGYMGVRPVDLRPINGSYPKIV